MNKKLQQVKILRLLGFGEAMSWILLLFIAMPLKYLAGEPQLVSIVGWIHGLLFVLYISQLLHIKFLFNWPFKTFVFGCIAAFFPFGTLVFDKKLREQLAATAIG